MKIASILPISYTPKVIFNGGQFDYSKKQPSFTSKRDVFIKGEEKLASSLRTRRPLEKLYEYDPPCFCCGRKMINPLEIQRLRTHKTLQCKAPVAIKVLSKYKDKMHSVEKEVFEILEGEAKKYPDMDFKQILQNIKPEHEAKLVTTQLGIFKLIEKASEHIKLDSRNQIKDLLQTETAKIIVGDNNFRRKYFVNKFEKIFENSKNTATKEHLIRLATKLPTSYEDKNAFIVKYSARSAEDIGLRLLNFSMDTIEHVRPKAKGGENHLFNYVPECMRCNSFRQDRPMRQQLEEHPEMFYNAQKLIDWLIDYANKGKLSKWYIINVKQRVFEETDGLLNLDISNLQMNSAMKDEYKKMDIEPVENFYYNLKEHSVEDDYLYESAKTKKTGEVASKGKKTKKMIKAENLKERHKKISASKKSETKRK
jgi:hypothetical protein